MVARRPKVTVLIALTLLGALTIIAGPAGAAPVEMSLVAMLAGGVPQDVAIDGDYAYVAAQGALSILDISNPASPVQVGFFDTPGSAEGVAVSGSYVYVADWDAGLRVIDMSDPTAPVEVGSLSTSGYASGVTVSGGYAYVADHGAGLSVIDVSDPRNPTEVGQYDTAGSTTYIAVSG